MSCNPLGGAHSFYKTYKVLFAHLWKTKSIAMPDAQVNNLFQFNTTNPGFRGQYIKLAANKADKIGLGSNFNNVRSSLPSIRLDQLIY